MPIPRPTLFALTFFLNALAAVGAETIASNEPNAAEAREIPLPAIETALPSLPGPEALPVRKELPDVLTTDRGEKVTTRNEWQQRRAEILDVLSYYAVGRAPPPPGNVKGREISSQSLAGGKFRYRLVHLTFGPDDRLGLDIGIYTPAAGGPFPAVISPAGTPPGATPLPRLPAGPTQGRGTDVLLVVGPGDAKTDAAPARRPPPADPEKIAAGSVALARGYAYVTFNYNDCGEDTTLRNADGSWAYRTTRFFPAYPDYDWGLLRAWAWGVSRIIDFLETDPAIDKTKLIVTGASRTGKSAMVAAAFDERIALGAPVVTGGGGIGAYRLAGPRGSETLDVMVKKYPNWFSAHLREFRGKVEMLPFDEHWFLAACAPRPFIALEGTTDVISLPEAVRASIEAAKPVYALFDAEDRLGVNYANHGHAFTDDDWNAMLDFADRHLRGRKVDRAFNAFPTIATAPPIFNVRDFGAVGDGVAKDTAALQKALDACAVSGGGEVYVPTGKYLSGSLQMGMRTTLRLADEAAIVGSGDFNDYPMIDIRWEGRWQPGRRALIYAANVDHIAIVGRGRIEGNPAVAAPQNPRGAVVLEPISCTDVHWEGFTVTQGGNWATHPTDCTDVTIKNVTITGRRDGIDVDSCKQVRIEGCHIDTGDDSISLKSGRGLNGARIGKPTEDVLITNCTLRCSRFACIGIGSEISAGVRNIRIEHCTMDARTHAIYIKSRVGRAGLSDGIAAEDLEITGGSFLRINLASAGNTNTADDPVEGPLGIPEAHHFSFSNVRVRGKTLVEATQISPEKPLVGLTLANITGTCDKGITLANIRDVVLRDVKVTGFTGPLLAIDNVTGEGLEGAEKFVAPSTAAPR